MTLTLQLQLNGQPAEAQIDSRLLLTEALRDHFSLMGTRIGCLNGDCGACTVRLNGKLTKSCLVLAQTAQGGEVTTIEGMRLEGLKQAFIADNAFQCGFCTTGMLLAADHLLRSNGDPSENEIRQSIAGNLCRCTGYDDIVAAIRTAARRAKRRAQGDR
jgi:aerobic-type carbon monoxide dehydrogenase small subunit (CoxS/CutS family)